MTVMVCMSIVVLKMFLMMLCNLTFCVIVLLANFLVTCACKIHLLYSPLCSLQIILDFTLWVKEQNEMLLDMGCMFL